MQPVRPRATVVGASAAGMPAGMPPFVGMVPPPVDPASWQQWCQTITSLNALGQSMHRPGTPLGFHQGLGQLQAGMVPGDAKQRQEIAAQVALAAQAQGGLSKLGSGGRKQTTSNNTSRSTSPANVSANSQQNAAGAAGPPYKSSRHKYAEQRRRNRINERLDQLRTIVPHPEGTNIASFLDIVIDYVVKMQQQMGIVSLVNQQNAGIQAQLEQMKKLPVTSVSTNSQDDEQEEGKNLLPILPKPAARSKASKRSFAEQNADPCSSEEHENKAVSEVKRAKQDA